MSSNKSLLRSLILFVGVLLCSAIPLMGCSVWSGSEVTEALPFTIDERITNGEVSTADLYIGTVQSILGDRADGRTPLFAGGFGFHPDDIVIMNDRVGVVLAVGSPDPWGYPAGSILDAGRIFPNPGSANLEDASFGENTVLTVQFLFNSWDAWAPANAGTVAFDLIYYNFNTLVESDASDPDALPTIRVERKFLVPTAGGVTSRDLDVISYYSIAPGADYVMMIDTLTNRGNPFDSCATHMMSLSNQGGDGIDTRTVTALTAANTYNQIMDEQGNIVRQFATTLISPGANVGSHRATPFGAFAGEPGYREFHFANTLPFERDETRIFESFLLIDDQASWQRVFDFWADFHDFGTFNIKGTVTNADGEPVPYPVILIYRGGSEADHFFGWVLGDRYGNYTVDLPDEGIEGLAFYFQVEARGKAAGPFSSPLTIADDGQDLPLVSGANLIEVVFNFVDEDDNPIWGRINLDERPTALFTGQSFFFSDVKADGSVERGQVTALLPPGEYRVVARGEGHGFYSFPINVEDDADTLNRLIVYGNTANLEDREVTLVFAKPLSAPRDWFSFDAHHHGTRADAFSPPAVAALAQITAGLEVLSLSDHDFLLDNYPAYLLARDHLGAAGYKPSVEVTASWAHFDAVPLTIAGFERLLDRAQQNQMFNPNQSLQGILDEIWAAGAGAGIMHPNQSYGLFRADDNETVPGGMSDHFVGIESNFRADTNNEAIALWNAYLTGGSHRGVNVIKPKSIFASTDIHEAGAIDEASNGSGARRTFVFVENGTDLVTNRASDADFDAFSLEFSRSFARGQAYNSSGVILTPVASGNEGARIFGKTYMANPDGSFSATFKAESLGELTAIYVLGSRAGSTFTAEEGSTVFNSVNHPLYIREGSGNSAQFTVTLDDIRDREWISIAVIAAGGRMAISNPIWIVPADTSYVITAIDFSLPASPAAGARINRPDFATVVTTPAIMPLMTDWVLENGEFGVTSASSGGTYDFSFTIYAPGAWLFDESLASDRISLSPCRTRLIYTHRFEVQ